MKLCTLLITFTDANNEVKQITTAHTFSSTDPRHYPQRRRVVHSNHREVNRNDRSYVTVSRSTDSPQGPLGSDMIERRPTYQPLLSSGSPNDVRQLTVQEVHLSYKCSNAETTTQQHNLPRAGPLYVDYTPIDENSEALEEAMGAVQTVPYKVPNHYASETNLMYEKNHHFDGNESEFINNDDENMYEKEYHQERRHQQHHHIHQQQQQRRGGSSEPRRQRKHKERFEEQYSFIQEESRNIHSHRISESVTKSMSYSRQLASPRRHSETTFEAKEPYREDGIRLYARYDDRSSNNTTATTQHDESTTVFSPTKRKKIEVEEERYRSIAPGPPMTNQGWRVPKLPSTIATKQQREAFHSEQTIMSHTQKKKPIVLPIDSSKREKFDEQKRIKLPTKISEISSRHEAIDFETYKREVERLKTEHYRSQNVTVFHDGPQPSESPSLPISSSPLMIPPVRIHHEIIPHKIEFTETITREPVQHTAKSVTEFPVFEPQIASYTPTIPPSPPNRRLFVTPPPRDIKVEEEAMKQFSEKLEILRNSKRFRHLQDSSQEFTFTSSPPPHPQPQPPPPPSRPQRTIEQIETIEIETEEYRRIIPKKDQRQKSPEFVPVTETITRTSETVTKTRTPSPQPLPLPPPIFSPPPPPTVIEEISVSMPSPPLPTSPPPPLLRPTTSIDEHKRHTRVEVTEEIITEVIERHRNRKVEEKHLVEKETQAGYAAPEVIETATETIFLPSVDTSTQFEQISHTVDSYTQHDTPNYVDIATDIRTPEFSPSPSPVPSSPDVITTENWTQMEEKLFTDVSTQETTAVTSVVDSSTQSEKEKPPPVIERAEKGTEIDADHILHESSSHNTTVEEIIQIDISNNKIPLKREESEESESRFEERMEETTTVTTDTMATQSREYESTLKEKPIPKRASPSTTTTTTAELKLKVSTPPTLPKMDYQSSDYTSSITSRSNYVRGGRNLSPNVSGTNRILKVVSESASMNSGLSPFGGSTAASSIRDAREREKKEMSDLNDRLASYIEKVRFLEAQNRKIGADLDFLRSRWGHDTFNIREMYESEIKQARKIIDESNADRDRLERDISKLVEEVATFRHKYDSAVRERATDKSVIDELLVKLSAIESELTLLKRRVANMEDDINAVKRENHRLLNELQRARTEVDQETLNRIDFQNQVQTIIEELDFVRRAHDSEIRDLQAMASRDTTSENREYFKNELAAAIREIRTEYDTVCNVQRTDMESWYKLKVQEIQTNSVRQNMEQGYTKEEMKRLRSQLSDLRGTLADLEGRNSLLEKQIEELHYQIEDDQRTYESALNDRDSQIRKLRDECHALMVELQMLLDTKQTLDAEIAIYRKMLEGEEDRAGLRQLVEQVVRTQQFRETQETESMRVIRGETSSRNSYQRSAQGNVSVQEASPDGKYIVVSNTHRSKQEPIGEWKIKRVIDHKHEVVFTFPKSFVLKPGQSVKIWARGHGTNNPPESIVFNGAESFGTGNNVQTILYNTSDEERATLIQRSSHTATDH